MEFGPYKCIGFEVHLKGVGGGEMGRQNNTAERVSLPFSRVGMS